MNSRARLCLALFVFAVAVMYSGPIATAQEQPVRPPTDVKPPETPSETPTGERDQNRLNQNDRNLPPPPTAPPPTAVTPERYADSSAVSWGSLLVGLIVGVAIGYLIGRNPRGRDLTTRNRAA